MAASSPLFLEAGGRSQRQNNAVSAPRGGSRGSSALACVDAVPLAATETMGGDELMVDLRAGPPSGSQEDEAEVSVSSTLIVEGGNRREGKQAPFLSPDGSIELATPTNPTLSPAPPVTKKVGITEGHIAKDRFAADDDIIVDPKQIHVLVRTDDTCPRRKEGEGGTEAVPSLRLLSREYFYSSVSVGNTHSFNVQTFFDRVNAETATNTQLLLGGRREVHVPEAATATSEEALLAAAVFSNEFVVLSSSAASASSSPQNTKIEHQLHPSSAAGAFAARHAAWLGKVAANSAIGGALTRREVLAIAQWRHVSYADDGEKGKSAGAKGADAKRVSRGGADDASGNGGGSSSGALTIGGAVAFVVGGREALVASLVEERAALVKGVGVEAKGTSGVASSAAVAGDFAPSLPLREGDAAHHSQKSAPLAEPLLTPQYSSHTTAEATTCAPQPLLAPLHPFFGPPVRMGAVVYPCLQSNAFSSSSAVAAVPTEVPPSSGVAVVGGDEGVTREGPSAPPALATVASASGCGFTPREGIANSVSSAAAAAAAASSAPISAPTIVAASHATTAPVEWDPFFGPPVRRRCRVVATASSSPSADVYGRFAVVHEGTLADAPHKTSWLRSRIAQLERR